MQRETELLNNPHRGNGAQYQPLVEAIVIPLALGWGMITGLQFLHTQSFKMRKTAPTTLEALRHAQVHSMISSWGWMLVLGVTAIRAWGAVSRMQPAGAAKDAESGDTS